jgi:hypothetical protein
MGGTLLVLIALLVSSPRHLAFWIILRAEAVAVSGYVFGLTKLYGLANEKKGSGRD